jgi:hypothetical protein
MRVIASLCLLASAAAFVPRSARVARTSALSVELATQSTAVPFLKRPACLDGTLAGDAGFDPLGLADSPANLALYAEAEVSKARAARTKMPRGARCRVTFTSNH